jgi:hypothetical protein
MFPLGMRKHLFCKKHGVKHLNGFILAMYFVHILNQGLKFEFFLCIHMDTGVLKFGIPPDNPVSQIWILN